MNQFNYWQRRVKKMLKPAALNTWLGIFFGADDFPRPPGPIQPNCLLGPAQANLQEGAHYWWYLRAWQWIGLCSGFSCSLPPVSDHLKSRPQPCSSSQRLQSEGGIVGWRWRSHKYSTFRGFLRKLDDRCGLGRLWGHLCGKILHISSSAHFHKLHTGSAMFSHNPWPGRSWRFRSSPEVLPMHMPPVLSLTSLRKQISRMLPPRLQTIPICPSGISTSWNARSLMPGRKLYFCILHLERYFLIMFTFLVVQSTGNVRVH